jgi:hypothetical protein
MEQSQSTLNEQEPVAVRHSSACAVRRRVAPGSTAFVGALLLGLSTQWWPIDALLEAPVRAQVAAPPAAAPGAPAALPPEASPIGRGETVTNGSIVRPFQWSPKPFDLPPSIKVFEGVADTSDGKPLRAWYVDINYNDKSLEARALLPETLTGRQTTGAHARKINALVAINAGYFNMQSNPAQNHSLVLRDGKVLVPNLTSLVRGEKTFPLTRGALGILPNRTIDITWIGHRGARIDRYAKPLPNQPDQPAAVANADDPAIATAWTAREGIGGGPMLMQDGQITVSSEAELFGGSHTTARHPRTAVGVTANNHLILFLVDGRQPEHSVGMSLPELAQAMRAIGCRSALNLDGGGSSALVINGTTINKPSGGIERAVTSIFAVVPANASPQTGQTSTEQVPNAAR